MSALCVSALCGEGSHRVGASVHLGLQLRAVSRDVLQPAARLRLAVKAALGYAQAIASWSFFASSTPSLYRCGTHVYGSTDVPGSSSGGASSKTPNVHAARPRRITHHELNDPHWAWACSSTPKNED